jgi:DNA-binding transcriptional LysR family regulator
MRLEQLQAFLAVVHSGSFQQASQQCGVTQSTISRQIQALEDLLGSQLIHRSTPTRLTVTGECFLPHAKKICQEWQTATGKVLDLMSGRQPELCVAVIHSVCTRYLPPVLQQFSLQYPQVQLRVTALGSDRATKVLRDGLVDLAIVMHNRFMASSAELVVDDLFSEPIQVLLPVSHPLATYGQVPWQELTRYPQVVFKDGYGMQRLVRDQFHRLGAEIKAVLELNTLDAFRSMVKQGGCIALLPQSALEECRRDPELTVRSTQDPILTRNVVLVTTVDRLRIPPIQHFRELTLNLLGQVRPQSGDLNLRA